LTCKRRKFKINELWGFAPVGMMECWNSGIMASCAQSLRLGEDNGMMSLKEGIKEHIIVLILLLILGVIG
jgi:hypothetical protein